jgi:isoleucyl-tRNA synthetase
VRADDLCFSEAGVELVLRQILIPLWNAYSFFITYARIYNWKPDEAVINWTTKPDAVIDQWILSQLNKLIKQVQEGMDDYDLGRAVEPFVGFVDQLTNWYIRRSRRRFWEDEDSPDRQQAFTTLYRVLVDLTKIAAPFVPFLSEAMYLNLRAASMPVSVHLADFPKYHPDSRNEELEAAMEAVQVAVSLGHSLRKDNKIKVRQPLSAAHVASGDKRVLSFLKDQQHLIADELNVKKVEFSNDETEFVALKAKPNFRVLGKKVGKLMRAVQAVIDKFDRNALTTLQKGDSVTIEVEGEQIVLTPEDVEVERVVHEGLLAANEGHITLALDTSLSEELLLEGLAREIVNKINTMRREGGFEVSDRIHVRMQTTDRMRQVMDLYKDYIVNEVLAVSVDFGHAEGTEWDLNGEPTTISIAKA